MLLGLGSGLPSYNLSVPHLALLELQRRCDEALEQGMCAVGTALELGVELCAEVEVTARQLHGLHKAAIGLVPEMTRPASCIS